MEAVINMALLTLLAAVTLGIIRQRNLFGVVVLASIYSFLIASVFMVLDAVDVAMTEAAVGAGVSTIVLLAALHLTRTVELRPVGRNVPAIALALVVGALLIWGTLALPPFGVPDAPIHQHVAPYYLSQSIPETGVANIVAAVLADYRGYDTLGEVVVVYTAGIGVMLLLRGVRGRDQTGKDGR